MKIRIEFLKLTLLLIFACASCAKNPYALGINEKKNLENLNSDSANIRIIMDILWYGKDKNSINKAIEKYHEIIISRQELDLKLSFSRYVFAYKIDKYSQVAFGYLLELAKLNHKESMGILYEGCQIEFFKNCDIDALDFFAVQSVINSPEYFFNNFVCYNYLDTDDKLSNLYLQEATLDYLYEINNNVFKSTMCSDASGSQRVMLTNRKKMNFNNKLYLQSLLNYLKNYNDPDYLSKTHKEKYSIEK